MRYCSGNRWNVAVKQHSNPSTASELHFIQLIHRSILSYIHDIRGISQSCLSPYSNLKTMPSIASMAIGGLMSLSLVANALSQITRSGKYLYEPDGTRFYIKVSQLSCKVSELTGRVSHINLKVPSQSRAPPTPRSESFLCFRAQFADIVVVDSQNRMSESPLNVLCS